MNWKNWRTGLAGIAAIATGAASVINSPGGTDMTQGIAAILAGIGLLTAKDAQVTGGTVPATPEAEKRTEKDK